MNRSIKILFVSQVFGKQIHGPSRKLVLLRNGFNETDVKIELRILSEDTIGIEESDFHIVVPNKIKPLRFLSKYWRSKAYYKEVKRIYKHWKFDYVVFNDAPKAYFTLRQQPNPFKVVAMLNDTNSVDRNRRAYESFRKYTVRRLLALMEYKVSNLADLVICPSSFLAERAEKEYKLKKRPAVLNPAIDFSEWKGIKSKVTREKKILLFVKSDPYRGGLQILLEAIKSSDISDFYSKLIVGGLDSFEEKQFLKYAHQSPIPIEWRGRLNRIQFQKAIQESDIGVVPSLFEAFSITTAEFAAGGLSVVASNAEGIPEGSKDFALFFESGNSKSLHDALIKSAQKTNERIEMVYGHKQMSAKLHSLLLNHLVKTAS